MGNNKKSKGGRKKQKTSGQSAQASAQHQSAQHLHQPPPTVARHRDRSNLPLYPPPFPHSTKLPLPKDGFLHQNTGCYEKSYAKALDTSYEGFVYDGPDATVTTDGGAEKAIFPHQNIRNALLTMEKAGLFRTDVTQPFGLGTKCAKTYVTRCLLGEPGTTYKYLGLRMFSHPWNGTSNASTSASTSESDDDNDACLKDALRTILQLNDTLMERTETHLSALDEKRKARGVQEPTIKGRAKFDIALINRMETSEDLKAEPMTGKGRCTVSWHADSCLENYSTVGVYHTLFNDKNNKKGSSKFSRGDGSNDDWSVALRVAHDAEGPTASPPVPLADTPVISTSLPSGAAYYMLDNFNHHHQHAVLAPESTAGGVRFSSTHRLLRLGHNVNFVIERCRSTCAGFHKKGPKVWRSEQLLLSNIESEWIRQFYVQGYGNKANLWPYWKDSMCTLLKYWGQLEGRTKQVVDILRHAAEECCGVGSNASSDSIPSRAERKLREKRKKAANVIADIMGRSEESFMDVYDAIYDPIATLIEERAKMRSLWVERGNDKVFSKLDYEYRPLKPPFLFESAEGALASDKAKGEHEEAGQSPLAGSPEALQRIAANLRKWGQAYQSQDPSDLPDVSMEDNSSRVGTQEQGKSSGDDHAKSLSWEGGKFSDKQFGLEMQKPWAGALLSGEKKIETRAYDLPPALIGKKILILESKPGKAGVSSLGNVITDTDGIDNYVQILGWAVFDRVIAYRERESFEKDEKLHLVTRDSGYGWKVGKTKVIYGWVCREMKLYSAGEEIAEVGTLVRRMRSLYQIQPKRAEVAGCSPSKAGGKSSGKKKKKRKKQHAATAETGAGVGSHSNSKKKKKRRY